MNSSDDKIYNLLEKLCENIVGSKNSKYSRRKIAIVNHDDLCLRC